MLQQCPELRDACSRVSAGLQHKSCYSPEMLRQVLQHAIPRRQTRASSFLDVHGGAPGAAHDGTRRRGRPSRGHRRAEEGDAVGARSFSTDFAFPRARADGECWTGEQQAGLRRQCTQIETASVDRPSDRPSTDEQLARVRAREPCCERAPARERARAARWMGGREACAYLTT